MYNTQTIRALIVFSTVKTLFRSRKSSPKKLLFFTYTASKEYPCSKWLYEYSNSRLSARFHVEHSHLYARCSHLYYNAKRVLHCRLATNRKLTPSFVLLCVENLSLFEKIYTQSLFLVSFRIFILDVQFVKNMQKEKIFEK